jgi:hypothetical protein
MKSKDTGWIVTINGHMPARFVSFHNAFGFRVECIQLGMTADMKRAPR